MTLESARIGFCCKWVSPHGDRQREQQLNQRTTTIAALARITPAQRADKLLGLVRENLVSLHALVTEVAREPAHLRLLRITSELLPAYTHDVAAEVYALPEMQQLLETELGRIGNLARRAGVRLGMHPGQHCVLNSRADVVANAVRDIEYHAQVMEWLGYTGWHQDGAVINIHGGARAGGTDRFLYGFAKLSTQARNLLTVENDEVSFGLDDLLPLGRTLPIVVDFHHHWIFSRGEYLQPDDPRIAVVIDSWRGIRPLSHISVSQEDLLADVDPDVRPDFEQLVSTSVATPRDLRAHSQGMWNRAVNQWAAEHLRWTDIEVEARGKNLAARQFAEAAAWLLAQGSTGPG